MNNAYTPLHLTKLHRFFDDGLLGVLFTGITVLTVWMVTVPGSKEMVILTELSIFTNTLLVLATALVWL